MGQHPHPYLFHLALKEQDNPQLAAQRLARSRFVGHIARFLERLGKLIRLI
jgi:hypothetical protein